jgi:hypothetical protein
VRPQAIQDGSTITFRSTGAARLFNAAFLAVWLCFWAVGEVIALAVIGLIVRSFLVTGSRIEDWLAGGGTPSFVMLFLLVWVLFWTVGGVAAGTSFLRSVAGEDRLSAVSGGFDLLRRAGPFRRRRTFERSTLKRVRLRSHDHSLVADGTAGTQVLTDLGTRAEREAALAWLREHLRLSDEPRFDPASPPPGWEATRDESGGVRLMKPALSVRRNQALVMWVVTAVVSAGWISPVIKREAGPMTIPATLLSILLAAGAVWLTWGRSEWIARPGSLVFRRRFGDRAREELFELSRLEVEHSTDSDGDHTYRLIIRYGDRRRTICSANHDDVDVVDCARWLAAATGFPLTLP